MQTHSVSRTSAGLLLAGVLLTTVAQAGAPESFACEAEARQDQFIAAALQMDLSRENALVLYELSGGAATDSVTGFAPANDRGPTVERALNSTGASQSEKAYYVEVDIQNLGGLNAELGHAGADAVYTRISQITAQHIESLRADDQTCSFRHGGDEFSFVLVGSDSSKADVEAALAAADQEIRAYIASRGLADIEHPKHPDNKAKSGAGIIFGVSQIGGQAQLAEVYSAADKVVEQKKNL